ncbi:MAG: tRNA (adenosine(37)-N6)-threonylcarbamoyltransferase complex dimerization subunit type 1 TsaB [Pseudoclavibacter sp.]
MIILALDTSAGTSIALLRDGTPIAVRDDQNTRGHAEAVGALVTEALDEADVAAEEIDLVVVGVGPGPFTGLRVGIAAGIGFAAGVGCPVVGVPSHDAVAVDALAPAEPCPISVATDARRHEVFVTEYDCLDQHGIPHESRAARTEPNTWPETCEQVVMSPNVSAAGLGRIAWLRHEAGLDQRGTDPIYVRQPDVGRAKPKQVL